MNDRERLHDADEVSFREPTQVLGLISSTPTTYTVMQHQETFNPGFSGSKGSTWPHILIVFLAAPTPAWNIMSPCMAADFPVGVTCPAFPLTSNFYPTSPCTLFRYPWDFQRRCAWTSPSMLAGAIAIGSQNPSEEIHGRKSSGLLLYLLSRRVQAIQLLHKVKLQCLTKVQSMGWTIKETEISQKETREHMGCTCLMDAKSLLTSVSWTSVSDVRNVLW